VTLFLVCGWQKLIHMPEVKRIQFLEVLTFEVGLVSLLSIIFFSLLMLYFRRLWKTLCLFDFSMCLICLAAKYRKVLCNLWSKWRMATSVSIVSSLGSFSIAWLEPKDNMLICSFVKCLSERFITLCWNLVVFCILCGLGLFLVSVSIFIKLMILIFHDLF